jgi:ATP-binding cassette subfamily B protein
MKYNNLQHIKSTFTKQISPNHCGLACLCTIVKYYGGITTQEKLQKELKGPSLYSLLELAQSIGFEAKGFKAEIENLKELKDPVILYVLNEQKQGHYIVCFGYNNERFILSDPSWGLIEYRTFELEAIWASGILLTLKPDENFETK